MRTLRCVALTVLLALVLGAAGALGGAAFHWYVVQPSDEELLAVAREVDLEGLGPMRPLVIAGKWAPSLDRGRVMWDAESDGAHSRADVIAELDAEGWTVDRVAERGAADLVSASRDGVELDVRLRASDWGGTEATVSLARGHAVPSLTATVVLGAVAGALAGVALGPAVRRPRRSPGKPASNLTRP